MVESLLLNAWLLVPRFSRTLPWTAAAGWWAPHLNREQDTGLLSSQKEERVVSSQGNSVGKFFLQLHQCPLFLLYSTSQLSLSALPHAPYTVVFIGKILEKLVWFYFPFLEIPICT